MLRMESLQIIWRSALLTGVFAFTGPALAGVSISYHGGHHGHGLSVGYGSGYHGHRGVRFHYNRYHGHSRHHKFHYRYRHYNYHYYPRHYYRNYNYSSYYRPRTYSRYPYSPRSSYTYRYPSRPKYDGRYKSGDAWTTLVDGDARTALNMFSYEAQSSPRAGLPKAGYAIAAASSGDLDTGMWAMRRAFELDADSLHELVYDTRLHETLDDLIEQYEYALQHRGRHKDEAFMVAALNYLKGDYAAADAAAARAAKDGDRSRSYKNLKHLLVSADPAHDDKSVNSNKDY